MKFSKKNQCGKHFKGIQVKNNKIVVPESALQNQLNDLLLQVQLKYIRMSDTIWNWIIHHAPPKIRKMLSEMFAGMPDNIVIAPINERYNLCMAIELKTEKGVFGKKQKNWREEIAVQENRSTKENEKSVLEFLETQKKLQEFMKNEE